TGPSRSTRSEMNVSGRYFHSLSDGRVQCDVCPRYCALHEGQRGFCFVRAREGDEIVLTTYGRSSGFCVDPIEKKPLNHFLPGTSVLSFGTAGCNLGCRFCQNWDMSKSREMDTLADAASPEQIARRAQELGCRSVAFTYNDPTIFLEYAVDVAQACHDRGIRTVSVTAGHPHSKMLDKPPTPRRILTRAREIGLRNGLRYVYTGNVHDESGGTTYCGSCGEPLIGRDWYRLTRWAIGDGRCEGCGAAVPGVFEPRPGRWGPRRLPVRISG